MNENGFISNKYNLVTTKQLEELRHMIGSPLTAQTSSDMTDHNHVYVYTGFESGYTYGNWYYWNGTNWTSGGVFNSTTVDVDETPTKDSTKPVSSGGVYDSLRNLNVTTDESLSVRGKPADAGAVKDALADKVDAVSGKGLSTNDYTDTDKSKVENIPNIDEEPTDNSNNLVRSGGVKEYVDDVRGDIPEVDSVPTQGSTNVVSSGGVYDEITSLKEEFSGEIGEIKGTAESTARRLNDIDTVVSTPFESGDIGAQNTYVANSKKIRTPQGQAIPLSVGSTITIASGAKVYLRGIKKNGTAYDGGTWKTGVYTVSTELNYLLIVSYDPEATVTDINALASMVTVRSVQTNPILKTQADINEVYDMLGKNLSFGALKGTIDSVSGENAGGMYPHIYSADTIKYTKTAVNSYAGIEMRIDDFIIGNTIAVRAERDIETTAFMIRIDFYGEDGTRVAPEKTTTENVFKRVIPDGTDYILITLPSNWGSALDVGTTVTYSNINIYYSDIEDLRDEEGNTTYTGEKIVLTNDNPKEHLCTVNQWLEYSEADLIEGLTTNKAFYKNQSMTIYGGYVFFFSENGGGFVADYSTKVILSEFSTEPATVNHNNSAQFSDIYYADDDEFPLLFVSRCGNASYQSGEHDLDEMLIYRVVRTDTTFTFTLINTVKINVQTYGISWGVDNVRHILYACAPINGNWQVQTGNYVDFWMVKEPTKSQILSGTPIVIGEDGIVAHFSHNYFTGQGCAVNGGKLFLGVSSGKQWVWVVDVFRGKILSKIPITNIAELEGVAIYNDKIYTTHKNSTNLYMFEVSF